MKPHFTLTFVLLFCASITLFSQAPLRLVTFNSANAAYSSGLNLTGIDDIYAANAWTHSDIKGAIAPEQGWYIFVGKSGTNA